MSSLNYPLQFEPIFRNYLWGGRKLGSELHKRIGDQPHYAESWEIVDHDDDQSVVRFGPLARMTLHQLMADHGAALIGEDQLAKLEDESIPPHLRRRFPLLFKFLDANRALSVQVHPTDEDARDLQPPDLGKTEAWVVMQADPGSRIFAGLREGTTSEELRTAMAVGETDSVLHSFEAQPGDCIFIPAGTVHAIGAGLLIAEIQQASDTTYRLFDWNRVGPDGQPRQLHLDQGMAAIDFALGPVSPQVPADTDRPYARRLVTCDKFILDRCQLDQQQQIGGDGQCHLLAIVDGSMKVAADPSGSPLTRGGTVLIPADCPAVALEPIDPCVFLEVQLP